jgi:uncharacterized protein
VIILGRTAVVTKGVCRARFVFALRPLPKQNWLDTCGGCLLISAFVKVDFRQVKPDGSEFSFAVSADDLELSAEGVEFPEPIELDLTATKTGDEMIFQGAISSTAEMDCSRCLDRFEMPIQSKIQFVIQLLEISSPQNSDDDDFVVLPKTTQEYDFSERVREAILLELPLKPLCSVSCRGLCPMCGTNLNESGCDCTPDKTDERWESLRQLFDQ